MADAAVLTDETGESDTGPRVPYDDFGNRLAVIRAELGLNVLQAAKLCELNDESWRKWERGTKPRGMDDVARKIARATGYSEQWLMMGGPLRTRSFSTIEGTPGQLILFENNGPAWSDRATLTVVE